MAYITGSLRSIKTEEINGKTVVVTEVVKTYYNVIDCKCAVINPYELCHLCEKIIKGGK